MADRVYWLDGTRMGDRGLETIATPAMHWALPILAENARLEPLQPTPLETPQSETLFEFDASAGQHAPAAMTGSMIMRGDAATLFANQISMITPAQRDQGLRTMWSAYFNTVTLDEVASVYDLEANVLTLTARGSVTLDWRAEGLIPPGATYARMTAEERPAGRFAEAPYAVDHPTYVRQRVSVRLPSGGQGFRVSGGAFDRTELGHHSSRTVKLEGDTATIEFLQRSLVSEIPASEAETARIASDARSADYPRIIPPSGRTLTDADRAAMATNAPTTEDGWLDRALTLSRSGDNEGALQAASRAVDLAPDSSSALANRGIYRFWVGDVEGATADMDKAVELDPAERVAMNGNALLANAEGRHQDVVIEMSRALRQAPTDDFALGMRARAYIAQGQNDRALRDIDALIAAYPDRMEHRLMRIAVLNVADRSDEASAGIETLLRDHPGDRAVVMTAAAYQLGQDRSQAAYDTLATLIVGDSEPDAEMLLLRAEALIGLGRIDDAALDFAQVRDASAGNAWALNGLCWTAALAGVLLDQALEDCEAALALEPNSPAILDSKGRVLLQQGKPAEARAIYDLALAQGIELSPSRYGRGLALIALGDVEAGEADKAAAIASDANAGGDFENYRPTTE